MNPTSYDGHDELYHHAKVGKIAQCAPAVGAKMWCLFFLFVCHTPSPEHRAFEGAQFEQALRCRLLPDFDVVFSIFSQGIALLDALHSSHFRR